MRHLAGLPLSLPTAGYQRVRRKKKKPEFYEDLDTNDTTAVAEAEDFKKKRASEVRVIVDARSSPKEATPEEIADTAYSQATAMVDSDDAEIIQLAKQVLSLLRSLALSASPPRTHSNATRQRSR